MTETEQPEAGTVAGAVAQRQHKYGKVGSDTVAATDWFGVIGPSHGNPHALVQLSLAQFGKVKGLYDAARANPGSFLSAVAECARLGLMPGDTYFYVPFRNKELPQGVEVTGITHWRGDAELMYNTGLIETIVCEVVREHDRFSWDPSSMRVPEHHIDTNAAGQLGLADDDDRGKLTAVYCYVIFKDGGTSYPTVLKPREVGRHRAFSKAGAAFWGPDYPGEGPFTVNMWKKTAIHVHRDSVPSSPEYLAQQQAKIAKAIETAPPGIDPVGNQEFISLSAVEPPIAAIEDGNGGSRPAPGTIAGAASARADAKPLNKGQALGELDRMFKQAGLDGAWRRVATALAGIMAVEHGAEPLVIEQRTELTVNQLRHAVSTLRQVIADCEHKQLAPAVVLLRVALAANAWDGEDPPPPDGFTVNGDQS